MAETGIPFSYVIVLAENNYGGYPSGADASGYADLAGVGKSLPVLADLDQAVYTATPWDGNARPGKCVLSPKMEILWCGVGHGFDSEAFAMIEAHAAANP